MKDIHHTENAHLHAKERILDELRDNGFADGFLKYGEVPVSIASATPRLEHADPCRFIIHRS